MSNLFTIIFRYLHVANLSGTISSDYTSAEVRFGRWCIGYGRTRRHPNDPYNEEVAKKVALARAIKPLWRWVRRLVWKRYFTIYGGPNA